MIKKDNIDSIDDVEFELIKSGKMKKDNKDGYINNKQLYNEMVEYNKKKKENLSKGLDIPPLTNTIGAAIIQIATRRCNSRMYVGYTNNWKEEMIGHAIVTATLRGHNFDPELYDNPFAYFTQICDNAIKEQLKKEKKQLYIRYKQIDEHHGFNAEDDANDNDQSAHDEIVDETYNDRLKFISDYEARLEESRNNTKANINEMMNILDLT